MTASIAPEAIHPQPPHPVTRPEVRARAGAVDGGQLQDAARTHGAGPQDVAGPELRPREA